MRIKVGGVAGESLQGLPLLLADIARHCHTPRARTVGARQTLASEGAYCNDIWVVKEGLLLSSKTDDNGHSVPAGLHPPNSVVGLLEAFDSTRKFRATVTTLTRVVLWSVRPEDLGERIAHNPAIFRAFVDVLAQERDLLGTIGVGLLGHSVKVRLLKLFLELRHPLGSVTEDGQLRLSLPIPRNVLATLIGTTPETLSRLIRELAISSVLTFEGTDVVIPDLDTILDIVAQEAA
ncbi:MAG: Crp/Fnr family transcriptional regulator [Polyangiaceae bacterium]